MSVYAVCSQCLGSTRLTTRLALDIARKPGPPLSLCCHADMALTYTPPTKSDKAHPKALTLESFDAVVEALKRDPHEHGPPPAPPSIL